MDTETKMTSVILEADLRDKLKRFTKLRGKTIRETMDAALREYFDSEHFEASRPKQKKVAGPKP